MNEVIPAERIAEKIFMIREQKVMLDRDLADMISSWGGTRYAPMAFTEQGVAMLSSVLNSQRAIHVNIQIMRTFTRLRKMPATHDDLKEKIEAMEQKYDQNFTVVFEAIRQLLESDDKPKPKIGYTVKERQKKFGKGQAKSVSDDHDMLGPLGASDR